jgi:signal transduction histidine kinase
MLAVAAVGTLTSLILVRAETEAAFRSYVFEGDLEKANVYATIIGEYYHEHGSFRDVEGFLTELPAAFASALELRIRHLHPESVVNEIVISSAHSLFSDRIVLAGDDGTVIADTASLLVGTSHPPHHLASGAPVTVGSIKRGTVLVGSMIDTSMTERAERFLSATTIFLLIAGVAASSIALLLGAGIASNLARPLKAIVARSYAVAAGDFSSKVDVEGDSEIKSLGMAFNAMTERLGEAEMEKRRMIADSAHELRTPAALIRGMVEAMLDGVYPTDRRTLQSLHEEAMRLDLLIRSLKELELIDSGRLILKKGAEDVASLIEGCVSAFEPAAMEKGISLEADATPGLEAEFDRMRIGEALAILVDNALKYGRQRIVVSARGSSIDGREAVAIAVDDAGSGIPEAERARIFDRFYRLDKSRASATGGRGLGLAIASEIAKAHSGSLAALASPLGGARFELTLPRCG